MFTPPMGPGGRVTTWQLDDQTIAAVAASKLCKATHRTARLMPHGKRSKSSAGERIPDTIPYPQHNSINNKREFWHLAWLGTNPKIRSIFVLFTFKHTRVAAISAE